jgi:hypothetical protein
MQSDYPLKTRWWLSINDMSSNTCFFFFLDRLMNVAVDERYRLMGGTGN